MKKIVRILWYIDVCIGLLLGIGITIGVPVCSGMIADAVTMSELKGLIAAAGVVLGLVWIVLTPVVAFLKKVILYAYWDLFHLAKRYVVAHEKIAEAMDNKDGELTSFPCNSL